MPLPMPLLAPVTITDRPAMEASMCPLASVDFAIFRKPRARRGAFQGFRPATPLRAEPRLASPADSVERPSQSRAGTRDTRELREPSVAILGCRRRGHLVPGPARVQARRARALAWRTLLSQMCRMLPQATDCWVSSRLTPVSDDERPVLHVGRHCRADTGRTATSSRPASALWRA